MNFYVFDSHGPVHEANEAAAENIQVMGGGAHEFEGREHLRIAAEQHCR